MKCGAEHENPVGHFYKNQWSELYLKNDRYVPCCKKCVNEIFDSLSRRYKSDKTACILICHMLDLPYYHSLYDSIVASNNNFSLGLYARQLSMRQMQYKTFNQTILENELNKTIKDVKEEQIAKWKTEDLKNKNYVLQTVGYDCFDDDSYTQQDLKFLYNSLSDYLTDDTIEDPHKLQCVISIVKTSLQIESVDRLINNELKNQSTNNGLIKSYTETKQKLSDVVNKLASENGVSAKSSGKSSSGSNTLTNIMKEMLENNYDDAKVNIVDIKMSNAYRDIAEQNSKALFNELNNQSDEYARMLGEQAKFVEKLQDDLMVTEEENRKLKIQNKKLLSSINQEGDN